MFATGLTIFLQCSTVLCWLCLTSMAVVLQHLAILATALEQQRTARQAMWVPMLPRLFSLFHERPLDPVPKLHVRGL